MSRVARFVCPTVAGGLLFVVADQQDAQPRAETIGDGEGYALESLVKAAWERYGGDALAVGQESAGDSAAGRIGFADGMNARPFVPRAAVIVAERETTAEESHSYFVGYAEGMNTRERRVAAQTKTTRNDEEARREPRP